MSIKPYHFISLAEKYLIKGLSFLDKKPRKIKNKQLQKRRKKNLECQVEYVYDELSKSEKKGIVKELDKQHAEISQSKEKSVRLIDSLKHIKRLQELEKLRGSNIEKSHELKI